MARSASPVTTVTKADLEAKFRALQGEVQGRVDDKKQSVVAIAGGLGLVLMLLMFVLGKRSGRAKTTLVEIRRV